MGATMQSLGIDKLSLEEQLALVHEIWDHIVASGANLPLSNSWREELRRRVAEDDAEPNALIPWEQVKAEALKRCRR